MFKLLQYFNEEGEYSLQKDFNNSRMANIGKIIPNVPRRKGLKSPKKYVVERFDYGVYYPKRFNSIPPITKKLR